MASGGSGKLDFEFPDSDEASSRNESEREQGTRENATARTPESVAVGEKRDRAQELKQSTAKKDKRPSRKRLQEHWRDDRAAGNKEQRRGGKNKERRRALRAELQPGAAAEDAGAIAASDAGVHGRCERPQCKLKRAVCRSLIESISELQQRVNTGEEKAEQQQQLREAVELKEKQVDEAQRRLERGQHDLAEQRAVLDREKEQVKEGRDAIARQRHRQLYVAEQVALATQGDLGRVESEVGAGTIDWRGILNRERQGDWCSGTEEYKGTVPFECAVEVCSRLEKAEKDWLEAVGFMAEVKGAVAAWAEHRVKLVAEVQRLQSDKGVAMNAARSELKVEREQLDRTREMWELSVDIERRRTDDGQEKLMQERRRQLFGHMDFVVGQEGLRELRAEADNQEVMHCKEVAEGWAQFNVKDAPLQYFGVQQTRSEGRQNDVRLVRLRRECRGLVLDGGGSVQMRPVQKFYRAWQLGGVEKSAIERLRVQTVTEKLDGEMMCGVMKEGQVELWSRGGWTPQARSATKWASENRGGVLTLVAEVCSRGGTATFEYVGRQSRVKVRYEGTDVVLLAARDRETGVWWEHEELVQLGEQHGVTVVRRIPELEKLQLHEIDSEVNKWVGVEGVVILMSDGMVLKAKSKWWRLGEHKEKRRWYRPEGKQQARRKELKRKKHMEREDQRVVLRGWNHWLHPSRVFKEYVGAVKVEAVYRREDGRQGSVVVRW